MGKWDNCDVWCAALGALGALNDDDDEDAVLGVNDAIGDMDTESSWDDEDGGALIAAAAEDVADLVDIVGITGSFVRS